MRLRWPIRRGWTWPLTLLLIYAIAAWGLAIALPYQPRAAIELPSRPNHIVFSSDNSVVVAGGWNHDGDKSYWFRGWDARSGRQLSEIWGIKQFVHRFEV